MDSMLAREAALQERRRQEIDSLKQQRKERAKTSTSANFSGKQKKQQLRARKHRLNARKEDESALMEAHDEYEEFYMEKRPPPVPKGTKKGGDQKDDGALVIEDELMEGVKEAEYHDVPDFFERNHDLSDDSLNSRLKLTVALGRHNKDHIGKELSSFFVKETKEQIHLRLMEGQLPLDLTGRTRPLLAKEIQRDALLDHPRRPEWHYKMSKDTVDANESVMFDQWLTQIHDKYDNEQLNHFEHNLEVWRELWRVTERATHVVVVTDIRNPLLHIPPSVYDVVTAEMQKPMTVVLNKIDLVPASVVEMWKVYLKRRFPKCRFICFSSRSNAVRGDNNISARRRVLSKKLEVGDPSAVNGAMEILRSCGINAVDARRIAVELNAQSTEFDLEEVSEQLELDAEKTKRKPRRKQKGAKFVSPGQTAGKGSANGVRSCQHCGSEDAVVACLSCAGNSPAVAASIKDEGVAISRGYLLCRRCDREEHADLDDHQKFKLTATRLSAKQQSQVNPQNAAKITIGLIGHPNVGKSSVLNALAGKKLVSVSHTPGHTKRLQSIMITPEICICDCPGLVFPFAGVPKYLQELCGLYPYSQIREPYSAVRFLAENLALEKVLDVKPRTQLFDGIEEELDWSPWTLCEAYAEKKGYRTDRRGRPDHQRAGSELIRDTVDGIVPLYFLPPDYKGKHAHSFVRGETRQEEDDESNASEDDEDDGDDQDKDQADGASDDEVADEEEPKKARKVAPASGKINAFSLLDSSSDESDRESDSD